MATPTCAEAISAFGVASKAKLANPAATGSPEDQLRAPLEALIKSLALVAGLPENTVELVGETSLSDLAIRPDFAVSVQNALAGFIELKAPGKGADPRRFTDQHDKKQWSKLKSLPNLLYTDGNAFSLWRNGELQASIIHLAGDVGSAGARLTAPPELVPLMSDFLRWNPEPPRTVKALAATAARLCRLLRDEVTEELERGNAGLTGLATEWRALLFPEANDAQFADGYAQAVTFGLLVARARGIELSDDLDQAARELRSTNSLIATALRLLTDADDVKAALKSALQTLARVLNAVDWSALTKDDTDAWLYFYEDFLEVYDNSLRKQTGSYYTPPEVVAAMVRLVDEALKDPDLLNEPQGLASHQVTVADPAVGTGAYLLGVLRRIAQKVREDMGPGAVPGAIAKAAERLIGFEIQFGPFAVAQLRLLAEFQTLAGGPGKALPELRLFVTDTLGDPYAEQTQLPTLTRAIGESRQKANAIKRGEPITVVIGNPPYKEKAKGRGGWIESGSKGKQPAMARWMPPKTWGVGTHAKHLKNLYIYFWRWATWKVFGSGHSDAVGEPDTDRAGVICFITVAGFLNGPGFQKMRADLREQCSDIWVIDCSPEGHQPEVSTRVFQGVQQPVCIVLALKPKGKDRSRPAAVRFHALGVGNRKAKFAELDQVGLKDTNWLDGPSGWRDPLLPSRTGAWSAFIPLASLFDYNGSGVMPGRTWVVAPDSRSLVSRWGRLLREPDPNTKELLFHPHIRNGELGDKSTQKVIKSPLPFRNQAAVSIAIQSSGVPDIERYGFRTLDRQWIIADSRVLNQPNPTLWQGWSNRQVTLTSPEDRTPSNGPAVSFTSLIPDLHHYHGRGGRVFPLWRDPEAKVPNVRAELLTQLAHAFGRIVEPGEVMAYIAALLAHPAFTARFQADLKRPGLRVPVTADAGLFDEAVRIGQEVIWLHCYGERFADPAAGRPAGPPRMAKGTGPTFPEDGGIPGAPEPLPDTMTYDPAARRLMIGSGLIDNVPQAVWDYEVSGKNVLRQWFSYRRRDRSRPIIGDRRPPSPLDAIQPEHWPDEYTVDLINLLHVLGRLVALEPLQAALLERVCAGELLAGDGDSEDL